MVLQTITATIKSPVKISLKREASQYHNGVSYKILSTKRDERGYLTKIQMSIDREVSAKYLSNTMPDEGLNQLWEGDIWEGLDIPIDDDLKDEVLMEFH